RNRWAAEGAIREYGLDPAKTAYVGNCGLIDPPPSDAFAGGKEFIFVSTDFRAKNGALVVRAFEKIREKHSEARLTIIGDPPARPGILPKGVRYEGFLRKEVPSEAAKFSRILARARALLHPTSADTNPMILIEAGYFGCPAVATRICGIPEMIDHGLTGYLIDYPATEFSLRSAIEKLLADEPQYLAMRKAAREKMCGHFSQPAFQERIMEAFHAAMAGRACHPVSSPPKKAISYVSNLPAHLMSGGFSGMNSRMLATLQQVSEVTYVGPIDPVPSRVEHVASKIPRSVGFPGKFFFFSERRLQRIASALADRLVRLRNAPVFFHGFTPWVFFECPTPFVTWSDCTFRDYVDVYHRRADFDAADLRRIEEAEATWLQRAERVLFTSRWAADRAIRSYFLDPLKVAVLPTFSDTVQEAGDKYRSSRQFAFVSTDFAAKGGMEVAEAIAKLRRSHPEVSLIVAGDRPPVSLLNQEGIEYVGFLAKEHPDERQRLRGIFESVRAVVHPTRSDISPLLLVEAGTLGCPAITTRICGIPEIVEDDVTGILLESDYSSTNLVDAMERLLSDEEAYSAMRKAVSERAARLFSKTAFEEGVRRHLLSPLNIP
ncbi:MAG: glycosyltransferase family 4 protein, partial [Chthoniobacterales bacterium]